MINGTRRLESITQIDCLNNGGVTEFAYGPTYESYDGTKSDGRRRPVKSRTLSEDKQLHAHSRQRLVATHREMARNYVLLGWMIRKHLDYTTSFSFRAKTQDEAYNTALETWVDKTWGSRNGFDLAGRHRRSRFMRIAEGRRIIDGDFGILKIAGDNPANRGLVKGIEADLITSQQMNNTPRNVNLERWEQGVRFSQSGRALEYMLAKRTSAGRDFDRIVPASAMYLHAYFDSTLRHDQIRGVSPLSAAYNSMQDTYEGITYTLAKLKVAQMFGLITYKESVEPITNVNDVGVKDEQGEGENKYEVDFGPGPIYMELDENDRMEFLENKTPATETQDFLEMMIMMSLKALDIPFSMWNESFTNFYGSRGGLIQYLKSSKPKIEDNRELLNDLTRWRVGMAVADGEVPLPRGMSFQELEWEWIHDGVPWWDPVKEVTGAGLAVAAGFQTFDAVTRMSGGGDIFDNIRANAAVLRYAEEQGFPISLPGSGNVAASGEPEGDTADGNIDQSEEDTE